MTILNGNHPYLKKAIPSRAQIERHITWDRGMWGSDQSSSVEIPGLIKLAKGPRDPRGGADPTV